MKKLMRKKLAAILAAPKGAPYFCDVEYLESNYDTENNKVPYIDAGIIASWDEDFEFSATITKTTANRILVCGNYPNQLTFYIEVTASSRVRFGSQTSTSSDPTFVSFDAYTNTNYPIPLNVPTKIWVKYSPQNDASHTVNYEVGLEALDGSVKRVDTGSCYRAGSPGDTRKKLRIFNDYRSGTSTFDGGFKMHQCEIKMGTQHKKFIAALDFDIQPCMYDVIGKKLYYNGGTGNFVEGSEFLPVAYLKATGTQYLQGGLVPTTNTGIDVVYSYPSISANDAAGVSGTYQGTSPRTDTMFISTNSGKTNSKIYLFHRGASLNTNTMPVANEWYHVKINWLNDGKIDFNDGTAETNVGSNSVESDDLVLFGRLNASNDTIAGGVVCIKSCKVSEGSEIVRDYIPSVRLADSQAGFFDRIHRAFFYNKGTDEFEVPLNGVFYKPVAYLESTGRQYIDIGIKMKNNYSLVIRSKMSGDTTQVVSRYMFGDTANLNRYMLAVSSSNNMYIVDQYSSNRRITSSLLSTDGLFHSHKINKLSYYIDSDLVGTCTYTDPFETANNCRLFKAVGDSTTERSCWQIPSALIVDKNGKRLRNYLSVVRVSDSVAGMYDTVGGLLYTNDGSGDFTVGARS